MNYINLFSTQSEYDNAKLSYPNISYIEETEKVLLVEKQLKQYNNQIFYTTTDGQIVTPRNVGTIISNTYEDGQGVITFASDVTSIGIYAFGSRTSLTSIDIPSGVTSIGVNAFYNCQNLTLTELPSGVTSIGEYAFYNCQNLTLTELPSGVTSIGEYTFQDCTSLTEMTIPSGVTNIGNRAFCGCTSLTTLTYNGTSTQFNTITKGYDWKFNVPDTCIVHCTDGDFPITQFA